MGRTDRRTDGQNHAGAPCWQLPALQRVPSGTAEPFLGVLEFWGGVARAGAEGCTTALSIPGLSPLSLDVDICTFLGAERRAQGSATRTAGGAKAFGVLPPAPRCSSHHSCSSVHPCPFSWVLVQSPAGGWMASSFSEQYAHGLGSVRQPNAAVGCQSHCSDCGQINEPLVY